MGDMNSVLQEKFSGIKVIKSSGFEDEEVARFKGFTREFRKLDLKIYRLRNIISRLTKHSWWQLSLWCSGLAGYRYLKGR